jgi:hypothetical protein
MQIKNQKSKIKNHKNQSQKSSPGKVVATSKAEPTQNKSPLPSASSVPVPGHPSNAT